MDSIRTLPDADFSVKSVILIAIPHPAYARVDFDFHGRTHHCISLVQSDFTGTDHRLAGIVNAHGYHIVAADNIPLKRLAVRCGLALYGRNNITYIGGLGSYYSFVAYFSDIPPDEDVWVDVNTSALCGSCGACVSACPTGAIRSNRFLIDNERCLSYLNERADDFPQWLSPSVHHCAYDCLQCQLSCPMNLEFAENIAGPFRFNESETAQILSGNPVESFEPDLASRVKALGLHEWPGVPRNLKMLFETDEAAV